MEQRMIKIQDAMKSHFIGEIQFDDDEIEEMKLDCRRFYQRVQQSWSKVYSMSEISELIVLIVNIAKTWNDESEGRFWIKLFGEIFEDGSISPVKFYNDFEACLKFYHKALFRSKENKRMFREVFLLHAFAPQKSGEEFIRLLWNWFCDEDVVNFDYQQGDIVFEKLAQFLKKEFGGKTDLDEEVNFEGKTYSIKASFKYLFTQDTESGVVLLDKLFSDFDDIYFNGKYDSESYFAECCAEVIEKIQRENSQPTERRARKATEHIISDYSKIYSGYEIDPDGFAFLFIPEIRAIDEVAEEYVVDIYNGTEKIYSIDGYIVGSNIKKRIRRIAIPFSAFAGTIQGRFEIEVKLSVIRAGQEIEIYSSARSLYRDFILFKSSREVRSEFCKPGTYYLICGENFDLSKVTNCGLRNLDRYTSVITAEENDYIRSENQVVFFNQTAKDSHVIIDGTRCENVVFQKNEMEFPMYKKVRSLNILISNTVNPNSIALVHNGEQMIPLTQCGIQTEKSFHVDLSLIHADEDGCHQISVFDVRQRKLLHNVFYYLNSTVAIRCGNGFVFDNKTIETALFYRRGDNELITQSFQKSGNTFVDLKYEDGLFHVDLPYVRWRIDENDWNYSAWERKLWHKNDILHNNCIIEVENKSVYPVSVFINDEKIALSKDGAFLLGDALNEHASQKENEIYLEIGTTRFLLFKVFNREELFDFNIDLENKEIDFTDGFIGDADARFYVELKNDENSYEFEVGIKENFNETIIDGEYDCEISLLDFWGKKIPLLHDWYAIGNPDKFYFNNRKIILQSFKSAQGGKIKFRGAFIGDIEYLREERVGKTYVSVYRGMLYDKGRRNPVEVYKKDENSLKIYFMDGSELKPVGYDIQKSAFTTSMIDDKVIVSCTSCYYSTEEI